MSTSPDTALTVQALQMAWELRGRPTGVMFHSDQVSHYTSRKIPADPVALPDKAKHESAGKLLG